MNYSIKETGKPRVDLTGKRFTKLTVVTLIPKINGKIHWLCKCDCGNEVRTSTGNLNSGNSKSCGCYQYERRLDGIKEEMIGITFGRLKVMSWDCNIKEANLWNCKCTCGNEVRVRTGDLNKGHTQSCGCLQRERAAIHRSIDLKGKTFSKLEVLREVGSRYYGSNSKTIWLCKCKCGNEIEVPTSALTTGNTRSCGCLLKEMVGKKHHGYNPNKTDEERMLGRYIIGGMSATKWRKEVFNRDNYTCLICNQYGGALNAHHLDGWGWCKERRFDITNGVTLCVSCHNDYHKIYGKLNNTEEQFKEYILKNKKHKQLALF